MTKPVEAGHGSRASRVAAGGGNIIDTQHSDVTNKPKAKRS